MTVLGMPCQNQSSAEPGCSVAIASDMRNNECAGFAGYVYCQCGPAADRARHALCFRVCTASSPRHPLTARRWSTSNGVALHTLQVRITLHAARLLTVGGRMVYSTCTFNPIEDEAVVAEVLRRAKVRPGSVWHCHP